jgi:hypothetical protein
MATPRACSASTDPRRPATYRKWAGLVAVILLGGCAALKNTPEQDIVWELGKKCEGNIYTLTEVHPDGSYVVRGAANVIDFRPFFECMHREQGAWWASAPPNRLVAAAFVTDEPPAAGSPSPDPPKGIPRFERNRPVTFFYVLYKSGRVLQERLRWVRPDGGLEHESSRRLGEGTGTSTRTRHTTSLRADQVRDPGTWRVELFLNEELVGTYPFEVR